MHFSSTSISVTHILLTDYIIMRSDTNSILVIVYKKPFRHRNVIEEQSIIGTRFLFTRRTKMSSSHGGEEPAFLCSD